MTLAPIPERKEGTPAAAGELPMVDAVPSSLPVQPASTTAVNPPSASRDERAARQLPLRELLAEDFATYQRSLTEPGLWAVVAHRLGARAERVQSRAGRALLGTAHRVLSTAVSAAWGIELPASVELGRRVRLWHFGSMRLHAKAIGNDVHIRHDTNLGPLSLRTASPSELPTIGDRVDLGVGVCVMGDVRVGEDSVVGANSLVTKSVPPSSTVLGVPARILPR